MKSKLSILDKLMMAITFAEAGEHETARYYAVEKGAAKQLSKGGRKDVHVGRGVGNRTVKAGSR